MSSRIRITFIASIFALSACGGGGGGEAPPEGACPNYGTSSSGVDGEACANSDDCACGLFCEAASGSCQPYTGGNAGCLCEAPEPQPDGTTSVDPGTTPIDEGTNINANCSKPAPDGAQCNPYCQIGCDDDEQCSFKGWGFGCTGVGSSVIGEACSGYDGCSDGMSCLKMTGEEESTCRRTCIGDSDCPGERKCDFKVNFSEGGSVDFCGALPEDCDPFTGGGCEDGKACYFGSNTIKCLDAGTLAEGDVCHGVTDNRCAPGLQCAVTCIKPCSLDNSVDPKCSSCEIGSQNLSQPLNLGFCISNEPNGTCDIFAQDCPSGQGCYGTLGGHICMDGGSKDAGQFCDGSTECKPGHVCIAPVCVQLCDTSDDANAGESCSERCGSNGNLSPMEWGIGFCTDVPPEETCSFWDQDCPAGKGCYPITGGDACMPITQNLPEGSTCQAERDCAPGLVCDTSWSQCVRPCSIPEVGVPDEITCATMCGGGGYTAINNNPDSGLAKCDQ
jgi:hypothetical protein